MQTSHLIPARGSIGVLFAVTTVITSLGKFPIAHISRMYQVHYSEVNMLG
jgi:hypothetical protein